MSKPIPAFLRFIVASISGIIAIVIIAYITESAVVATLIGLGVMWMVDQSLRGEKVEDDYYEEEKDDNEVSPPALDTVPDEEPVKNRQYWLKALNNLPMNNETFFSDIKGGVKKYNRYTIVNFLIDLDEKHAYISIDDHSIHATRGRDPEYTYTVYRIDENQWLVVSEVEFY